MATTDWDLTRIYPTHDDFLKEAKELENLASRFDEFKGKLKDGNVLASLMAFERDYIKRLYTLEGYASQKENLDESDVSGKKDLSLVTNLENMINTKSSYIDPELLALGEDYFVSFFKEHPECQDFDFDIKELFLNKNHVLKAEEEKLLSYSGLVKETGSDLYGTLSVADFKPKEITLSTGEKVKVTQSSWLPLISRSENAEDRKAIFEALYSWYDEHKTTYGAIYNAVVQAELSSIKERNYPSILASHLEPQAIPEKVFTTLVDVASHENAALKKYVKLREKYLPLKEYHTYERYLTFTKSDKKYTYDEAKDIFYQAIAWYPTDYQEKAREVTKDGYVDVYEKDGKHSGAYSTGGEAYHPYILLNFQGTLDDVFTLAHESGHSVHTLYSMENQPFMKSHYRIFVAEIASTFNEHNLLDELTKSDSLTEDERIVLLQKAIDEIVSTFYRQTLFAHYEYNIAKKAEKGEPLNYEVFNHEMISLYQEYYGMDIKKEKLKQYVWAYIPHLFYTPFYVYQYATSFTASMAFYKMVRENPREGFEKYLGLLKMGGSDYPVAEVLKAGVDLTKRETYLAVTERMSELVDELEKELIRKFGKEGRC